MIELLVSIFKFILIVVLGYVVVDYTNVLFGVDKSEVLQVITVVLLAHLLIKD